MCASDSCEIASPTTSRSARRAAELELDCAVPLAGTQRVPYPGGERRESGELGLARDGVPGIEELQHRERRLAEGQRDRERGSVGQRQVVLDRSGLPRFECRVHELGRTAERGIERAQ